MRLNPRATRASVFWCLDQSIIGLKTRFLDRTTSLNPHESVFLHRYPPIIELLISLSFFKETLLAFHRVFALLFSDSTLVMFPQLREVDGHLLFLRPSLRGKDRLLSRYLKLKSLVSAQNYNNNLEPIKSFHSSVLCCVVVFICFLGVLSIETNEKLI